VKGGDWDWLAAADRMTITMAGEQGQG